MPIYEYTCESCGKTAEVLQKMSDPAPAACPACGKEGTLSKIVSRNSFQLKGGGWYADLYSSTKKTDKGSESAG